TRGRFLSLAEAGRRLYLAGSDDLRGTMEGFTQGGAFPNLAAAGESYVKTAIAQKVCGLYVRWTPDEPYIKADVDDFAAFEKLMDGQGEFAVKRADLRKIVKHYG